MDILAYKKFKVVKDVLDYLVKRLKEEKLAIFCGSGISINPPSNLPSGLILRQYILNKIFENLYDVGKLDMEIRERLFFGKFQHKHEIDEKEESIKELIYPFEAFIQCIDNNIPILETLVKLFSTGSPNKNHMLLAHLIERGYLWDIMTTNFDTKIEEAIESLNPPFIDPLFKIRYNLYYSEYQYDDTYIVEPSIYKIHGSIHDIDSIRATLSYISNRIMLQIRKNVIENFFKYKHHDILILGYSASDEFDVNPILRNLNTKNKIFKVEHISKNSNEAPSILELYDPFNNMDGCVIRINTDILVDYLWDNIIGIKWVDGEWNYNWRKNIQEWILKENYGKKTFLAGWIFFEIQEYETAKIFYNKSLKYFKKTGNQLAVASTFHQIANIYFLMGNYEEAKKLYNKSSNIRKELNDKKGMAGIYGQIANIYFEQGDHDKAEKYYKFSMDISEKEGILSGVARSLHQLGIIYEDRRDYEKAEDYFNRSMKIFDMLGDQSGVYHSLHELANLYSLMGDYKKAENLNSQSIAIKMKLGDGLGLARSLQQLARIHQKKGELVEAEKLFNQSIELFQKIGDRSGEALVLSNLASLSLEKEDYNKAEKLLKKNLNIIESLGNFSRTAKSYYELANIYMKLNKFNKAEEFYEKSKEIGMKIGYILGVAKCNNQLGNVQYFKNNFKKAEYLYYEAMKVFEKLNSKYELGVCYNAISRLFYKIRDFKKSKDYTLKSLQIFKSLGLKEDVEAANMQLKNIINIECSSIMVIIFGSVPYKLYKDDIWKIEEETGKKINDLTEDVFLSVIKKIGIMKLELTIKEKEIIEKMIAKRKFKKHVHKCNY